MVVGNKMKVMDTFIDECTQKKLAKSSKFFKWVCLSGYTYKVLKVSYFFVVSLIKAKKRSNQSGATFQLVLRRVLNTDCLLKICKSTSQVGHMYV